MDTSSFLLKQGWRYMQDGCTKLGLSYSEGMVLLALVSHGNINQEQISKESDINKFLISKIVTSIEEKGYVSRNINPNNRREYIVQLTESGKEKAQELIAIRMEWSRIVYQGLSQSEIDFLNQILNKMVKNICQNA